MPSTPSQFSTPSRDEIDRLVERGRRLQGEALLSGFKRVFNVLADSGSLRGLRITGQRQPCT
jgi:hypothetical protein